MATTDNWLRYETAAKQIIARLNDEFGLSAVEGKQVVDGKSGAQWEIDAKGLTEGSNSFVIIECRRYTTSRIKQEQISGIAWRILDTGASGALVVSPLGLQEGASKVAAAAGVRAVRMSADATLESFVVEFLGNLFVSFRGVEAVGQTGVFTPVVVHNSSASEDVRAG
jgi:hypothetical protein